MNKGDPLSNKPIKNIKINKGDKNIKPISEKKKSKQRFNLFIHSLNAFFNT